MSRFAVDPVARTIRAGDRVWPFEWEPAAATAAIVLEGRPFELQPLTWRRKCNLARAARKIGPSDEALGALLASACLPPRTSLPTGPLERAVLVRLARWLIADDADVDVPWDPAILARIAVDVCRAAHVSPQSLDLLPAADVESMWHAVQQPDDTPVTSARAAEPPAPGFKKIVVVPDPIASEETTVETSSRSGEPSARVASSANTEQAFSTSSSTQETSAIGLVSTERRVSMRAMPVAQTVPHSARRVDAPRTSAPFRVRTANPVSSAPPNPRVSAAPGRVMDVSLHARPTPPNAAQPIVPARGTTEASAAANSSEPVSRLNAAPAGILPPAIADGATATVAEHVAPTRTRTQSQTPSRAATPFADAPPYDPFMSDADPFADEERDARNARDAAADRFAIADDLARAALDAGFDLEG
ncbi:MAG: hypothetical protein QM736_22470 [Vicinamibacterales bacterium]